MLELRSVQPRPQVILDCKAFSGKKRERFVGCEIPCHVNNAGLII